MIQKEYSLTTNNTEMLFTIECDAGCTCLGFDVCQKRSIAMANWLGVKAPSSFSIGTVEGYERYLELTELCRVRYQKTGERCPTELTTQLIGLEGRRVEVVDKWGEKRRFKVGKSTGWIPCHIELARSDSSGGPSVSGAPFQSLVIVR